MGNRIKWLRISYWTGAIVDALAALRMLFPDFIATNPNPNPGYNVGMKWGAALMIAWTGLLIWADRKPLERKFVLLLTICPAIIGLMITSIWVYTTGYSTLGSLILNISVQIALIVLFGFSYWNASE